MGGALARVFRVGNAGGAPKAKAGREARPSAFARETFSVVEEGFGIEDRLVVAR
jgi:hypothetical protein